MTTFLSTVGILSFILAVGAIDGPTGHEMDNWWACLGFTVLGLLCMVGALQRQGGE